MSKQLGRWTLWVFIALCIIGGQPVRAGVTGVPPAAVSKRPSLYVQFGRLLQPSPGLSEIQNHWEAAPTHPVKVR